MQVWEFGFPCFSSLLFNSTCREGCLVEDALYNNVTCETGTDLEAAKAAARSKAAKKNAQRKAKKAAEDAAAVDGVSNGMAAVRCRSTTCLSLRASFLAAVEVPLDIMMLPMHLLADSYAVSEAWILLHQVESAGLLCAGTLAARGSKFQTNDVGPRAHHIHLCWAQIGGLWKQWRGAGCI